jgi:hypothetical protein
LLNYVDLPITLKINGGDNMRINKYPWISWSVLFGVIASLIFLLSACSISPSVEDAKKALETGDPWIKNNVDEGVIRIASFHKAGGTSSKLANVKYYSMNVNAKIEYIRDAYGFRKGKTGEWKGAINFRKDEKGWVVLNVAGFMYY